MQKALCLQAASKIALEAMRKLENRDTRMLVLLFRIASG